MGGCVNSYLYISTKCGQGEGQNIRKFCGLHISMAPQEDWCCDICGTVTKYKARHMASAHKVTRNVNIAYCHNVTNWLH